ncbi:heterokaryon incompatibility protein-domain-containing protein [Triangularia verruculosa]|uniref:Heterokaryon incompatibility protein-domain-containing protein n=1 Tax=Triangularia verruculosa TaxID=2587418 RepID=A0AAN7B1C6_9PEZI|nr:heterokaryon incompatibility protein-domain-containing protein [Triangularia verruculosa]
MSDSSIFDLCQHCEKIPFDRLQENRLGILDVGSFTYRSLGTGYFTDSSRDDVGYFSYSCNSWELGELSRVQNSPCPVCRLVSELIFRHNRTRGFVSSPFNSPTITVWINWIVRMQSFWINTDGLSNSTRTDIGLGFAVSNSQTAGGSLRMRFNYLFPELPRQIDIDRLSNWIEGCARDHQCISKTNTDAFNFEECYPGLKFLRYIDVNNACLIQSCDTVDYIALSYVWGSISNFRLTKANLKIFLQPAAISAAWNLLPATIRDAITLTRKLGKRYLWIDSLCLVQNDPMDLEPGIAVMDQVYERAWITIIAASGHDANAGLPGVDSGSRQDRRAASQVKPGIFLGKLIATDLLLEESAYHTRAWTLQEHVLSRRTLYFFQEHTVFRCHASEYRERCCDHSLITTVQNHDHGTHRSMELGKAGSKFDVIKTYMDLIEGYTSRTLTLDSDVLRAIAGVIRRVSVSSGYQVLQGLPRRELDIFLLFEGKSLSRREGFPSYSWAGWRGKVEMHLRRAGWTDCELSLNLWLRNRTWIVWYVSDLTGKTELVCDDHTSSLLPRQPFKCPIPEVTRSETVFTSTTSPKPYPILRFWTLVVSLKIQITDVFRHQARLLGQNGEECGGVALDGFNDSEGFFESIEPFDVILLSEGRARDFNDLDRTKTGMGSKVYLRDREYNTTIYYVMLIEWKDGVAERRGIGAVRQDSICHSFKPGPVWKEVALG